MPPSQVSEQQVPHIPSDPARDLRPAATSFAATEASVLLDLLRGLAALLVLAGHWRNLLFVDFPSLSGTRRALFAPVYALTAIGHQCVVVFFVLSGYLIAGSIFRSLERDAWSWRSYLLHRWVRLWIVLLPGLLLAALCDGIGLHLHRQTAALLYSGGIPNHIVPDIRATIHLSVWLANLLFVQGIGAPVFGSDRALWSLAFEFWYYLLFPLALMAALRRVPPLHRLLYAVAALALAWWLRSTALPLFPIWLGGALLAKLRPPDLGGTVRAAGGALLLIAAVIVARTPRLSTTAGDLAFGLVTFFVLAAVIGARRPVAQGTAAVRAIRVLARFSYTLYVVHLPLLVLAVGAFAGTVRSLPGGRSVAAALLLLAAVMAYAYGVASLTEFRTDALRRFLERRFPAWGPKGTARHVQ